MAHTSDPPQSTSDFKVGIICRDHVDVNMVRLTFDRDYTLERIHLDRKPVALRRFVLGLIAGQHVAVAYPRALEGMHTFVENLLANFPALEVVFIVGACGATPKHPDTMRSIGLGDLLISTSIMETDTNFPIRHFTWMKAKTQVNVEQERIVIPELLGKLKTNNESAQLSTRVVHHLNFLLSVSTDPIYPGFNKDRLFQPQYSDKHYITTEECMAYSPKLAAYLSDSSSHGNQEEYLIQQRRLPEVSNTVKPKKDPSVHFGCYGLMHPLPQQGSIRDGISSRDNIMAFSESYEGYVADCLPTIMVGSATHYADGNQSWELVPYAKAIAASALKAILEIFSAMKSGSDPVDYVITQGVETVVEVFPDEPIILKDTISIETSSTSSQIDLVGTSFITQPSIIKLPTTRPVDDYTVACIFPMGVEYAAGIAMLDDIHDDLPMARDHNVYTLGRIGRHFVVLAAMPETGVNRAASVVTQLLNDFRSIRIGLLVGIGGGLPSEVHDIRLGDIVVSKPTDKFGGVVQYDLGKSHQGTPFRRTGVLNKPPRLLQGMVQKLKALHHLDGSRIPSILEQAMQNRPRMRAEFSMPTIVPDLLFKSAYPHHSVDTTHCRNCDISQTIPRPKRLYNEPKIHYGTIGSANRVLRDAILRDELQKDMNLLCVEMEAAGIMDEFPCLVIRGICDYADSHKNKTWQPYAAATAAAYMKELLLTIPPRQVMDVQQAFDRVDTF